MACVSLLVKNFVLIFFIYIYIYFLFIGVALSSGGAQFPGTQTPTVSGMDIGDQQGKFGSMKNRKHTPIITEDDIGMIGT
jgi:hypothetical protein